ncbi:MAG: 3-phosphoserine/phosphohydroxythreonine transaminase [Candidatus Riflebacteria bacterium]|nr:3-phosphoserine/phosphohydroxythreonine transaminase [Candidatus Riflebacteria bacterium]
MTQRVFNFSAGPAVLPVPVLEEVQRDMLALPGAGMSILEISHRAPKFDELIKSAEKDLRTLLCIPDDYAVLFLQGGATLQFSMVPMNLMPQGGSADYIITGHWSQAAVKEARKWGTARIAATVEESKFTRIPQQSELQVDPAAAYVHYTSNNTIYGTEWNYTPQVGAVPLVCDASSDFLSRPIDVKKHGLIYAGAQKNVGPAGVVITIIRKDLLARTPPKKLPTMLDYAIMAEKESLYNTPPCFCIYVVRLVLEWLLSNGGLGAMAQRNQEKAKILYDAIDASGGYYRGHAQPDRRSLMNVTFRMHSEELEKKFAKEATAARRREARGLHGRFPEEERPVERFPISTPEIEPRRHKGPGAA